MKTREPTPIGSLPASLREELSSLESRLEPIPSDADDQIHAAVSLVLREGRDLELLLIRRAEVEGDPWSGHMALPGGRRDPGDASLLYTALRETEEERYPSLAGGCSGTRLGRFGPLAGNVRLPRHSPSPLRLRSAGRAEARVASREVDAVHWVTLAVSGRPQAPGDVDIPLPGGNQTHLPLLPRGGSGGLGTDLPDPRPVLGALPARSGRVAGSGPADQRVPSVPRPRPPTPR